MTSQSPRRSNDFGEKVFLRLLSLYPAEFRRRFADEMLELFNARRMAARSPAATARVWTSVMLDAVRASARERMPRRGMFFEHLGQDVRHAWRVICGNRAFSALVIALLVVAEVAVTVALSIGAALLAQSFLRLNHVDPGFMTKDVVAAAVALPDARYHGAVRQRAFVTEALTRLADLPGVDAAAATNMVPQGGGASGVAIAIEGPPPAQPGEELAARYRVVSTEYFRTLGVRVLRGRTFDPRDARAAVPLIRWFAQQPVPPRFAEAQASPVAVINAQMAREIWPGADALGRSFRVLSVRPSRSSAS